MSAEVGADSAASDPRAERSRHADHPVRVGQFEGPLDLLLHLVRANEVDITDIPIVTITEQYNEYLELMRELNLEIAGEYIVMAATLMHIKSRMLLPPDPEAIEEEGDDPRAELTQQLLDYQRFKQAAESLEAMESRRSLIWTRDRVPAEFQNEELLAVDMFDLMKAFRKLVARLDSEARMRLKRDTVSVADKISWLTDLLARRRTVTLGELVDELPSTLDLIATFLALLEMMKLSLAVAFQRTIGGEIHIAAPRVEDGDAAAAADEENG